MDLFRAVELRVLDRFLPMCFVIIVVFLHTVVSSVCVESGSPTLLFLPSGIFCLGTKRAHVSSRLVSCSPSDVFRLVGHHPRR